MKIKVNVGVSQNTDYFEFDLEDLNVSSQEEWELLSEDEKQDLIQISVNDLHSQPYWVVDAFREE